MEISSDQIIAGFLLTLLAGLATGIGSCLAFFPTVPTRGFWRVRSDFPAAS